METSSFIFLGMVCLFVIVTNLRLSLAKKSDFTEDGKIKNVLILGGGIAGLSAARKLLNHKSGKFDVTVIEAKKNRYGGRIWTNITMLKGARGVEGDLGAMWINSKIKDNPILKIVEAEGLETKHVGHIQLHSSIEGQQKILQGDDANKIFTEAFSVLQTAVDEAKTRKKDVSLNEAVDSVLTKYESHADKALISAVIRSHRAVVMGDHSAQMFDAIKQFGWDTVVLDGFHQVVDAIVSGEGQEDAVTVDLNKIVRQIEVKSDEKKVIVRTRDLHQYTADLVIVALPLGVIKSKSVLFQPLLPKRWVSAANNVGVDKSNKLVLGFEEAFWPEDIGVFTMVTDKVEEVGFLQTWINLQNIVGKPYLMGMLHGKAADDIETMSKEDIKVKALAVLAELFGEDVVKGKNLTALVVTRWQEDPHFQGSGTYPKTGANQKVYKSLTEPVCPFIYFAGSYTSLDGLDSAHGAYWSGQQVAEQVMSEYCEKKMEREKVENEKSKKKNGTASTKSKESLKKSKKDVNSQTKDEL